MHPDSSTDPVHLEPIPTEQFRPKRFRKAAKQTAIASCLLVFGTSALGKSDPACRTSTLGKPPRMSSNRSRFTATLKEYRRSMRNPVWMRPTRLVLHMLKTDSFKWTCSDVCPLDGLPNW